MNPAPPSLADLQRRMQAHVLDPHRTQASALAPEVAAGRGVPATRRLAVYTDAYRLRLLEILEGDFPALAAWLGPQAFGAIGRAYIAAHPSDTRSVRWYGRHLGPFLDRHAPERPLLAELARFDWARGLAFDAADDEPLEIGEVAAIPPASWPGLRLGLAASVQRLDLGCEIPAAYPELLSGRRPDTIACAAQRAPWVLWRRDLVVQWRALEPDEAATLDAAAAGARFGELCECLAARSVEDAALRAAGMLKRWIADGLVVALLPQDAGRG